MAVFEDDTKAHWHFLGLPLKYTEILSQALLLGTPPSGSPVLFLHLIFILLAFNPNFGGHMFFILKVILAYYASSKVKSLP